MKKYILGLTIAASTLSLAGCSDFLDTPVLGQQDLSEYFVNEDQCKQQITGCYQSIFTIAKSKNSRPKNKMCH